MVAAAGDGSYAPTAYWTTPIHEYNRRIDEGFAQHLESEGVEFLQFAFRWVNCLLVREVPFELAPRLWDTYLAEGPRLKEYLIYVLAAFLLTWKETLRCAWLCDRRNEVHAFPLQEHGLSGGHYVFAKGTLGWVDYQGPGAGAQPGVCVESKLQGGKSTPRLSSPG